MSSPADTSTDSSTELEIVPGPKPDTAPETSPENPVNTTPSAPIPAAKVKKWTVRGVPVDVRERATLAAKESGTTIGELVAEALNAYVDALDSGRGADGDPFEELDEMARYFEDRIVMLERRLTAYEADQRKVRLVQRPWIRSVS